jgi:hypothetical protein
LALSARTLLLWLAACGAPELAPVIETPPAESEAYPYADLERIELSAAHEGDADDLVAATFARDEPLELSGVPYADDLVLHMSGRVAGFEVAYGRTCAASVRRSGDLPADRLYFARTLKWASGAAPAVEGRTGGQAITARDGSVVFVGCDQSCSSVDVVDRFDPRTGAFASLSGRSAWRRGAVLAGFGDGRALVVGGVAISGDAPGSVDLLNPLAGSARDVETFLAPRLRLLDHAAATLVDGTILVAGGRAQPRDGAPFVVSGDLWLIGFDAAGTLALPASPVAQLATPRHGHTLTRLGDQVGAPVLVVGGLDLAGTPAGAAELYEPLRRALAPAATFAPVMVFPRTGHRAALLPDGSVLVVGGRDGAGAPVLELEQYVQGSFRATGLELDPAAGIEGFSLTRLPDGNLLIAGGRDQAGNPVSAAFLARLDPVLGVVDLVPTDALGAPRADHAAALLCDGTVFLAGGGASGSERFNPGSSGRR